MGQIQPIDIVAPGAKGLNAEASGTLLAPQWATVAGNAVVNRSGRIASRKGWSDQTTNAIAGAKQIDVLFEFLTEPGVSEIIVTADNKIFKDIDDFTDVNNDITSTTAPTADHWKFVNFNGKVLGFQKGHVPIERSSGDFTDASYTGTGPDGNDAVTAFGRVWAIDADLQTIRYSALLDDTDYSLASGGGTIDMSSVWTGGMDEIVAISAIGSNLIVFGKNHIVMWADKSGSEIGLDPTELEVVDTIEGTGCIARDSVKITGEGDLLFLSRHGIQTLGRVIQQKSNPLVSLSKNVNSDMLASIAAQRAVDADFDQVRAVVSPEDRLYIINFPSQDKQYAFDLAHPFADDEGDAVFPITTWQLGGTKVALLSTVAGALLFGGAGVVGKYEGESDNNVSFLFEMETGWLDFDQLNHRLKILKEIITSIQIGSGDVVHTWEFDFNGIKQTRSVNYSGGTPAEFNIAEFNIGEFSGTAVIQRKLVAAHGEGQFLKLGVTATINGFSAVIQHMSVSPKIGRMVT